MIQPKPSSSEQREIVDSVEEADREVIDTSSSKILSSRQKISGSTEPKQAADSEPDADAKPSVRSANAADVATNLLNLEREARRAETEAELAYLMVNGSRVAVQFRQAALLMKTSRAGHRTVAVSSLSAIDRNSTFIRWVERLAKERLAGENDGKVLSFDVREGSDPGDVDAGAYPFSQIALIPLQLRDGTVFAHLMLTRENIWDEASLVAAARLCETYSHAWEAMLGPKKIKQKIRRRTGIMLAGTLVLAAAAFIPVPLTALAPAEVTAADAFVVAAPIDGVVDTVAVDPNTRVKAGDLLFKYSDTELRNRLQLAGQAVGVAQARYQQSLRTSFSDPTAKRELSIAKSELQLKTGEYRYAKELLDKSEVRAAADGLVIFADKETWTGRPVATGERIMRIADPAAVEVTVNLPTSDAIVLENKARVQLYLDSNPLEAINAELSSASFHATPDGAGVLSYRVRARFTDESEKVPRIGLRGTAQVYGETVSLGFYLFRKPISAVRQWTGW